MIRKSGSLFVFLLLCLASLPVHCLNGVRLAVNHSSSIQVDTASCPASVIYDRYGCQRPCEVNAMSDLDEQPYLDLDDSGEHEDNALPVTLIDVLGQLSPQLARADCLAKLGLVQPPLLHPPE